MKGDLVFWIPGYIFFNMPPGNQNLVWGVVVYFSTGFRIILALLEEKIGAEKLYILSRCWGMKYVLLKNIYPSWILPIVAFLFRNPFSYKYNSFISASFWV